MSRPPVVKPRGLAGPPRGPSAPAPSVAVQHSMADTAYIQDLRLLMEFKKLKTQAPSGVYVLPSTKNLRRWDGMIFLRAGYYEHGVFRFVIDLEKYPTFGPRFLFTGVRPFSPLVNPKTGELDLSIQFPRWDKSIHFIALALAYVKSIFYKSDFWETRLRHEPFDKKAAELWRASKEKFRKRVRKCVDESRKHVHQNEKGSSLRVAPFSHSHSLALNRILRNHEETRRQGFSYAQWFSSGVYNLNSYRTPRRDEDKELDDDELDEVEQDGSEKKGSGGSVTDRRLAAARGAAAAAAAAAAVGAGSPTSVRGPGGVKVEFERDVVYENSILNDFEDELDGLGS